MAAAQLTNNEIVFSGLDVCRNFNLDLTICERETRCQRVFCGDIAVHHPFSSD
jgi:hypothetical protein